MPDPQHPRRRHATRRIAPPDPTPGSTNASAGPSATGEGGRRAREAGRRRAADPRAVSFCLQTSEFPRSGQK
jgi:hypothetical protein